MEESHKREGGVNFCRKSDGDVLKEDESFGFSTKMMNQPPSLTFLFPFYNKREMMLLCRLANQIESQK